jgi:hypothetical protein
VALRSKISWSVTMGEIRELPRPIRFFSMPACMDIAERTPGCCGCFCRHSFMLFKAIYRMESGLRDLIARNPSEEFRGIYMERGLNATRRNVLAPGAVGIYSAGSNYNPAQIRRDASVAGSTEKIDKKLKNITDRTPAEISIVDMQRLIALTMPDEAESEHVWDPMAISESLAQYAKL